MIREPLGSVLLALGAGAGLLLATAGIVQSKPAVPDGAVAVVNGHAIPESEYRRALSALRAERPNAGEAELKRHVLDRLVDEQLLIDSALSLGLADRDPKVRADLGTAAIGAIVDGAEEEPSEAKLREFYRKNRDYFRSEGRVRARRWVGAKLESDAARRAAVAGEARAVPGRNPDARAARAGARRGDGAGHRALALGVQGAGSGPQLRSGAGAGPRRARASRRRRTPAPLPCRAPRARAHRGDGRVTRRALLVLTALLLVATGAQAHTRSVSYSSWRADGATVTVTLRLSPLDLSAIDAALSRAGVKPSPETVGAALRGAVHVQSESGICPPRAASYRVATLDPAWNVSTWSFTCPGPPRELDIESDVLFDAVPGHVHFLRVGSAQHVLTASARHFRTSLQAPPQSAFAAARQTVAVGIRHILSGWDHLVFLFALLLFARSLRQLALVVSGFTIGHSITLSLAALGVIHVQSGVVEAAIGLSIVLVAVENVWLAGGRRRTAVPIAAVAAAGFAALLSLSRGSPGAVTFGGLALFSGCYFALLARSPRPERWRGGLAALFGLVHGLGFASVLSEVALPRAALVGSLLGFNVGVELGQLAVVSATWLLLSTLGAARRRSLGVLEVGSAAAAALGTYWFVLRGFS